MTNSKIKGKENKVLEKQRKFTLDNGGSSSPKLDVAVVLQNGGSKFSLPNK